MKYLYPPKLVLNKNITLNSIFEYESKSNTFGRKIFDVSKEEINLAEKQKLNEISPKNFVTKYNRMKILRFLYINNMDSNLAKKKFIRSERFLKRFELNGFSGRAENIIKKGSIYIFGRDKDYYPNLIIDIDELNCEKIKKKDIFESILYLSIIIIENMLIPYFLEQFNIVFKFKKKNIFEFWIKFLKIFDLIFCEIFPMRINNIFFFDFPFKIDQFKMPLYFKDKIKDTKLILNYYKTNNLETQFGGLKKIRTVKWPPLTQSYTQIITENDLEQKDLKMYKIFDSHQLFFLITDEMDKSYFSNKIESNLYFPDSNILEIKSKSSNKSFKKQIENTFKLKKKYHSKEKFDKLYQKKDSIRNILINSNYKEEKQYNKNKFSFKTFKKLLSIKNDDLKVKIRVLDKKKTIKSSKKPNFSKKSTRTKSIEDFPKLEDIVVNKYKLLSYTQGKFLSDKEEDLSKENIQDSKYGSIKKKKKKMKKRNSRKKSLRKKSQKKKSLRRSIFIKSLKGTFIRKERKT